MKTYFVSPRGTRDGLVDTQPCSLRTFTNPTIARPGDTALLFRGDYSGRDHLLSEVRNLHGEPDRPITIRAQIPGTVTLDAEFSEYTVRLRDCSHVVFEGLNFCQGNPGTVRLERSPNVTFRQCGAWENARSANAVWCIAANSREAMLDGCWGSGWGQKIIEVAYSDNVTVRNCYGCWEGSTHQGPKGTVMLYGSRGLTIDGGLFEWNAHRMPKHYKLLDSRGTVIRETHTYAVDQPCGIISIDEPPPGNWGDFLIDGVTVFTRPEARCDALIGAIGFGGLNGVMVRNCRSIINHPHIDPYNIQKFNDGTPLQGVSRINSLAMGGARRGDPPRVAGSEPDLRNNTKCEFGEAKLYLPPGMRERIRAVGGPDVPLTVEVE